MVPGLAETAGSFLLTCARLSSHFRCIAYELPNGRDDAAVLRRYRHADLVADLFALLDHLGIEQSYILGTSFGSTIALGALHAQPRRLLRGVLVGGFARRRLAPAERLLVALAGRWPGNMGLLPLRRTILRRTHGPAFAAREPACWDYFVSQSNSSAIRAVVQRALLMHHVDLRPLLGEIRQPILMVCGDADPLVGRDREEDLLRGLPNVVRVEFEHCGHFPQYTHPELLADVVRGFLTPLGCKEEKAHGPQSVGLE
jgi:pimeloyl-ACP methyl ester carboxylesterase